VIGDMFKKTIAYGPLSGDELADPVIGVSPRNTAEIDWQVQIDQIMDCFDFPRVAKVMEFLNWTWFDVGRVPVEYEIRKYTRDLLKRSANKLQDGQYLGSRGFMAGKENGRLYLRFELDSVDYEPERDED